ncbi:MAG: 4Fe-4S dicluster domain-containing protein [Gammaproteobacteria bacterium]|nr:4Fe-4S dicluster domain-containing protein [Gammaproteobacteria bacterium]
MSEQMHPDFSRREFLSQSAKLAAGVSLASGVMLYGVAEAKPSAEAVTSKVRWGMLIDTNKCSSGCDACVKGCNEWNGLKDHGRPQTDAQWIRKVDLRNKGTGSVHSLPMMCQHCEKPPCADVCPTGASFKRADGIVLVDKHICIGCRYCIMACPYKARSFIHEDVTDQRPHAPRGKGTVEACTMCVTRVDEGQRPACVEACNTDGHKAIIFGDLNDPNSEIAQTVKTYATTAIRADLGLNPGVRYRGI